VRPGLEPDETLRADDGSGIAPSRRSSPCRHSSASAFASGDRSCHGGGEPESCCRSDRSFRVCGTEPVCERFFDSGRFRRQAAIAHAASAEVETNCKVPIIFITPGNDINVTTAATRVSFICKLRHPQTSPHSTAKTRCKKHTIVRELRENQIRVWGVLMPFSRVRESSIPKKQD
jgi:hypothetical protein